MANYSDSVEYDCRFGNIMDTFADVELAQLFNWRRLSLGDSHVRSF